MTIEVAIRLAAERACAEAMRGLSLHGPFHSTHEAYAVILEELDETFDEIKANNRERAVAECIQCAAMSLRFIAEFTDNDKP